MQWNTNGADCWGHVTFRLWDLQFVAIKETKQKKWNKGANVAATTNSFKSADSLPR